MSVFDSNGFITTGIFIAIVVVTLAVGGLFVSQKIRSDEEAPRINDSIDELNDSTTEVNDDTNSGKKADESEKQESGTSSIEVVNEEKQDYPSWLSNSQDLDIPPRNTSIKRSKEGSVKKALSVSIEGNSQPYLVTPERVAIGIHPKTGDLILDYSSYDNVSVSMDRATLTLYDFGEDFLNEGVYKLYLSGISTEQYRLDVIYSKVNNSKNIDSSEGDVVKVDAENGFSMYSKNKSDFLHAEHDYWFFYDGNPVIYDIVVDFSDERIAYLKKPMPDVKNLKSEPIFKGGKEFTKLSWDPVAGAKKYNIYSMMTGYPFYELIDSVTATTYITPFEWSGLDTHNYKPTVRARFYNVTAVNSSGDEGFFVFQVDDSDRDGDALSDDEEINIYGTDINNPDTDGDGVMEFEEILHGTDPLDKDTDDDGYSDFEEINSGSDPLYNGPTP